MVGEEEDLEVGQVDQYLVGFPLIQQIIKLKQMRMEKLKREIQASWFSEDLSQYLED